MNDQVAAYRGLVESVANRFNSRHILAESDDLIQEGLIAVWQALEKGIEPGPEYIRNRMKDYVRKLHRESRQPEDENLSYDDDRSLAPSTYSKRERLSREGSGLDNPDTGSSRGR